MVVLSNLCKFRIYLMKNKIILFILFILSDFLSCTKKLFIAVDLCLPAIAPAQARSAGHPLALLVISYPNNK